MEMVKVKCITNYYDKELGRYVNEGEELEVSPSRASVLFIRGVAVKVEIEIEAEIEEKPKDEEKPNESKTEVKTNKGKQGTSK